MRSGVYNQSMGVVGLALLFSLMASAVFAQTQRGPEAPPPSGSSRVPAERATAPPSATIGPTLEEATKALGAAIAVLEKMSVAESCVVVDSRGDIVALHRMDRARFYLNDIAQGKALASVMFGLPGRALAPMANVPWFQNMNFIVQARVGPGQGGLPIIRNNEIYGAIGCSGGTGQQDEDAAQAGIETFQPIPKH
jgi:glc operon protein GlcG